MRQIRKILTALSRRATDAGERRLFAAWRRERERHRVRHRR